MKALKMLALAGLVSGGSLFAPAMVDVASANHTCYGTGETLAPNGARAILLSTATANCGIRVLVGCSNNSYYAYGGWKYNGAGGGSSDWSTRYCNGVDVRSSWGWQTQD